MKTISFDIECFNDPIRTESRNDFETPEVLEFGTGAICNEKGELTFYTTDRVNEFIKDILSADKLISYNGKRFDIPLLKPYSTKEEFEDLISKEHFDILEKFYNAIGQRFRIKLKDAVWYNLHIMIDKDIVSDIPKLIRSKEFKKVKDYNEKDAEVTMSLFKQIERNGMKIRYRDDGIKEVEIR